MGNIDYKAKFEKAMKDIAKIRKANKDNTELVEFIDFNYPELKETPTERMMKALLWFLGAFPYGKEVADGVTVGELVAWLEEDVKPKLDSMRNPTEWSKEDIRVIERACVALRAYANGDLPEYLPSELLGYADRLQSLKPQSNGRNDR